MKFINSALGAVRAPVRALMKQVARLLNTAFGGQLTANMVTMVSLVAHFPLAWFLVGCEFIPAAFLLVFFGLFDTLDGELARLQNRAGAAGMLLDASTDRMKEVLLYVGITYFFAGTQSPTIV